MCVGIAITNSLSCFSIMGATGTGKTTFTNLITGSHLRVGDGLESCTTKVQVSIPFELDGQLVELIDTPGFDDATTSDADVLNMVANYLCDTYREGKKLAGIIYMHRISDFRVGGIAAKNFRMFRQLCGDRALKNIVIVTNMWGEVSLEVGDAREQQLKTNSKFFKNAIDKGAGIARHDNTVDRAREILRGIMNKQPIVLGIQDEMINHGKHIRETDAAGELHRNIMEEEIRKRAEIAYHKEEAEAKSQQMKQEGRREIKRERKEIKRMENKRKRELAGYRSEQRRMERRGQQKEDTHRQKMEYMRARMPRQNRF